MDGEGVNRVLNVYMGRSNVMSLQGHLSHFSHKFMALVTLYQSDCPTTPLETFENP